jgi:hypothetical protein
MLLLLLLLSVEVECADGLPDSVSKNDVFAVRRLKQYALRVVTCLENKASHGMV